MTVTLDDLIRYKVHYYEGRPLISDYEYDKKEEIFKKQNPGVEIPVDIGIYKSPFETPYLSLKKLKTPQIISWIGDDKVFCTPKIDGVSMELILESRDYGKAHIFSATTRSGENRTQSFIRAYGRDHFDIEPGKKLPGKVVVRGECCLAKTFNEELLAQGFKNSRNVVAGMINSKDASSFDGKMDFLIWNWVNTPYTSYFDSLRSLDTLGLECIVPFRLAEIKEPILPLEYRNNYEYEIDGAVIWKNDIREWKSDKDKTSYQNAVAWKFPSLFEVSTIKSVEWFVGNSGWITPVAKIEPISLGGVTVSSINLFNPQNLEKLNVKIGSVATVTRAGDVIPHIAGPCEDTEDSRLVYIPETCPHCQSPVVQVGPRIRCDSSACQSVINGILNSWATIHDWKYFSEEAIGHMHEHFREEGRLHPIVEIYKLDLLILISNMTEGKAIRLEKTLKEARMRTTHISLLASLNVPLVGRRVSKKILQGAKHIRQVEELLNRRLEFGEIYVAENNLLDWIQDNRKHFEDICAIADGFPVGDVGEDEVVATKGSVVITGALPGLSRKEAEAIVLRLGYTLASSVSKGVSYLISEDTESASSKTKKAKSLEIPIVTWNTFLDKVEATSDAV